MQKYNILMEANKELNEQELKKYNHWNTVYTKSILDWIKSYTTKYKDRFLENVNYSITIFHLEDDSEQKMQMIIKSGNIEYI